MSASLVQQFLRQVRGRQMAASLARRWTFFFLIATAGYGLALIFSRLLGLLPAWFTPATLAIVPAFSLVLAALFYHRPTASEVARLVDARTKNRDLFLTASQIESSLGAYQELVLKQAEQRAAVLEPKKIVPFRWQRDAFTLFAAFALLSLGVLLLPQFDPFKLHQRQKQLAGQRERVHQISKATEVRAALLEQKRSGDQADLVKQAMANLEKTFQAARTNDKAGTLARLNEQQKILGQLWKQNSEEKLKNALNLPPPNQSFGLADPSKTEQMRKDLQKGDVSSANRELKELQQKAQELAKAQNPVEREKIRQELMDRLQNLKDTLDQQLNSQALDADMQRALEQLAMSNSPELSGDALKGMSDSLKLTEEEMRQLAKSVADLKNLDEALKALQLAKALHSMQPLDGQDYVERGDLEAYMAFCQGKCNSLCAGMGLGPGYGYGPRPHGDESSRTDFHPEKAASMLQPGKMLMEWKTREVSEAGPARAEYLQAVQNVRQQASEAVVQEQIPPGYQTAIKRYFDTLHNDGKPASKP